MVLKKWDAERIEEFACQRQTLETFWQGMRDDLLQNLHWQLHESHYLVKTENGAVWLYCLYPNIDSGALHIT